VAEWSCRGLQILGRRFDSGLGLHTTPLIGFFMPKIHFKDSSGEEKVVDAPVGLSLLEVAHMNNVDLEGACEGSLACSTCHVIVDDHWFDKLPKASEAEEDMLDLAFAVAPTSRLGCQITVTDELDGLRVMVPSSTRNH
jgi:2Fe-2S ferredoxin